MESSPLISRQREESTIPPKAEEPQTKTASSMMKVAAGILAFVTVFAIAAPVATGDAEQRLLSQEGKKKEKRWKKKEDCTCPELAPKPAVDQKAESARWMVHTAEWGVLTTLSSRLPYTTATGDDNETLISLPMPFGNVYSFVDGGCEDATGTPYFYGTYMDQSFADMKDLSTKASFTLSEASISTACGKHTKQPQCIVGPGHVQDGGDPESPLCARLTLSGNLEVVVMNSTEYFTVRDAFYTRHPQMKGWPVGHNWIIGKLNIEDVWFIDFFGGASIVSVEEYYAASLEMKAASK